MGEATTQKNRDIETQEKVDEIFDNAFKASDKLKELLGAK